MTANEQQDLRDAEHLFLSELPTIERVIHFTSRRAGLHTDEEEEFGSLVKLKLIENGYAIVRRFERRSSFAAYLSVVVQRLLLDERTTRWGKWHASAEARKLGERAITIEAMLLRDHRTMDEVLSALQRRWPNLTKADVEKVARLLPTRTARPRVVELELAAGAIGADAADVDAAAFASDRTKTAGRIAEVIRTAVSGLDERDRLILRLRFEEGMRTADIARILRVEQKPLYRRIDRALLTLRHALMEANISAHDVSEVLASRTGSDLDFGCLFQAMTPMPHDSGETP